MADRYLNLRQAVVDAAAFLAETIERAHNFAERGTIQAGPARQEPRTGSE